VRGLLSFPLNDTLASASAVALLEASNQEVAAATASSRFLVPEI